MRFFVLVCRICSLVLLVAIGGVLYWGTTPVLPDPPANRNLPKKRSPSVQLPEFPSVEQMLPLASQSLRPPLYDPPPESKPEPPKPTPPPPIVIPLKLIGTIIDERGNRAVLTSASGQLEIRGPGEVLTLHPGGVTVESVMEDHITLRVPHPEDRLVTLFLVTEKRP